MLHRKLLLRRWGCVPWLLAVGLVLGWSGGAVADDADGGETKHSKADDHKHATDPYLLVTPIVDPDSNDDSIVVSWSTSYAKNFHRENGAEATNYTISLFKRETPAFPDRIDPSSDVNVLAVGLPSGTLAHSPTLANSNREVQVANDSNTDDYSVTLVLNLEDPPTTGKGFYWVRVQVDVADFDNRDGSDNPQGIQSAYFTKQIAVGPSYELTVNPSSVREDAGSTDIKVTVTNVDSEGEPDEVDKDTDVELRLGTNQTGLNDRFRMNDPEITIPNGNTSATGTITFIPIDDDDDGDDIADDDLLVTIRTNGASAVADAASPPSVIAGSTDIRLIDSDKASTAVSLSTSIVSLNKNDAATDIVVTATLNGRTLTKDLTFSLTIDKDYEGSARRDTDYDDTLGQITIRDGKVSGMTTINIRPKNDGIGVIRLTGSDPVDRDGDIINIGDTNTPVRIIGSSIQLTKDDFSKTPTNLQAMPLSVREDAVLKEVTLEINLENALSTDETVYFEVEGDSRDLRGEEYEDAVDARRDTEYDVELPSIFIPRGKTKGTGTMIVEPIDNRVKDGLRVFRVVAKIRGNPIANIGILISDDDTTSESITLDVSPEEIYEGAGPTEITVTGILDGKVFDDAVYVGLTVDGDINGDGTVDGKDGAATRDHDYRTSVSELEIPGGSTEGTMTFTITPLSDNDEENDEKIRLLSVRKPTAEDEDGDPVELDVKPATITLKNVAEEDEPDEQPQPAPQDPTRPAFTSDEINGREFPYTVGTAIEPLELPEAVGDDTPFLYNVFSLGMPTGLTFDPATRTLSGTPTAATDGRVTIIYTVVDSDGSAGIPLTFYITVNAAEEPEVPTPTIDAEIMATPSLIREDAGQTQVSLTVSLMEARDADERVTFTIVAPSESTEGKPAVRDVDYDATLGAVVTIPSGSTVGTSTLTLTPRDNNRPDGLRAIGVQATFSSGATLLTDIEISDDETSSTSITLSVNPHSVSEDAGTTDVSVTATLDGQALAADATVSLSISNASTAQRDVDYTVEFTPLIEIPAGSTIGVTLLTLRPIDDDIVEGDEIIKLAGTISGLVGDEAELLLSDSAVEPEEPETPETPGDGSLAFAADAEVADQTYTAGTAIDALVLPEASGGTAPLTYNILSVLPAGLSFDAATRALSGTPTAATDGAVVVIYTVTDEADAVDLLTFNITVNAGVSTAFGFADAEVADQTYTAGTAIDSLVLPEASGGTGALTYNILGTLPAGLSFDAATRTLSGTPSAATDGAVEITYIVTDEGGSAAVLTFSITVDAGMSAAFGFADAEVPDQMYTAGSAITPLVLPAASGGTGALTYRVLGLPAGLVV